MQAFTEALFSDTVESLYRAVTDESQWPIALAKVSQAFDSPRVALMRTTPQVDGILEIRQVNHDPATERQYTEHYWTLDPAHRLTRNCEVGQWLDRPEFFDPRTTPEPEYMEFAIANGIRYVSGGKVQADATAATILGLQRPADHKPFDAQSAYVFQRLGTHLGRAAMLSAELRRAHVAEGLSLQALDRLASPVFAVDSAGRLLLANEPGEAVLVRRRPFALKGNKMVAADPDVDVRLRAALAEAARACACAFSCRTARGEPHWLVRVVPVAGSSGVSLVYASEAGKHERTPAEVLQGMFGFTPAESETAFLVAEGMSAKEIARERGVSEHTVRAQVRQVFEKTGVRRMTELSRILHSVPRVRDAAQ